MNTNNDKYRSLLGSIRDVVSEEKIPNFSPGGANPAAQNAAQSKDGAFNNLSGMGSDDIQTPATEYQRSMEPGQQVTVYNGSLGFVDIDPNDIRLDYSRLEAANAVMRNNELIAYMEREFQGDSPQIAKLKAANVLLQRIADGTDPYQPTDGIDQIPDELRQTSMPETGKPQQFTDTDNDGVIDTYATVAAKFFKKNSARTGRIMGAG